MKVPSIVSKECPGRLLFSIDAFESVDDISEKVRKSSSIGTIVACLWRKLCVLYTHTLASML